MFEAVLEQLVRWAEATSSLDVFVAVVALTIGIAAAQTGLQSLRYMEIRSARFALSRRELKSDLAALVKESEEVTADGVVTAEEQERLKRRLSSVTKRVADLRAENLELRRDQRANRSVFGAIDDSRNRLAVEGQRLGRDSWINLIIGIAFAVFGIWILSRDVLSSPVTDDTSIMLSSHDIARLSLGLFVSLVAFFFFRMYLTNQNDIRHNKNELTTVEMRTAAIRIAIKRDDEDLVRVLLGRLMSTERNRILKRGERVVSESLVHERNEVGDLLNRLGDVRRNRSSEDGAE